MKKILISLTLSFLFIFSISTAAEKKYNKKPALMWFDATANFKRLSYPDSIDYYLDKIKKLGFTHAILDVRPISGEVLYKSQFAPQMKEWKGFNRPDFDFANYFITKAHQLGLQVHASFNVFVGGHNFYDRGIIYTTHPEWASVVYTPDKGILPITELKNKYSAMINPILPDYQEYILNIFTEFISKYPAIDGIILDRARYDGIMADFSNYSRLKFEQYIGQKIENFPNDIYEWQKDSKGNFYPKEGKHFLKWIEWRAKNIYDFMSLARKKVKSVNKNISFGVYTGAWYPSYYEVGVNFASKNYDPSKEYKWATSEYKNFGFRELLDLFTVGNYYPTISIEDYLKNQPMIKNETDTQLQQGTWYCVEGSCKKLKKILDGNPFYGGILASQFYNQRKDLTRSIIMNLQESDGVMIFDISHIIEKNLWNDVQNGMLESKPLETIKK